DLEARVEVGGAAAGGDAGDAGALGVEALLDADVGPAAEEAGGGGHEGPGPAAHVAGADEGLGAGVVDELGLGVGGVDLEHVHPDDQGAVEPGAHLLGAGAADRVLVFALVDGAVGLAVGGALEARPDHRLGGRADEHPAHGCGPPTLRQPDQLSRTARARKAMIHQSSLSPATRPRAVAIATRKTRSAIREESVLVMAPTPPE